MGKIQKLLNSLSEKKKKKIKEILFKIKSQDFNNLDIKKLKGREDIFRARKGKLRIIFIYKKQKIHILSIERRSDNTYN